ncbi:MAG: hypothetical protein AAGJ54_10690 [Planctomycetota bacterium]
MIGIGPWSGRDDRPVLYADGMRARWFLLRGQEQIKVGKFDSSSAQIADNLVELGARSQIRVLTPSDWWLVCEIDTPPSSGSRGNQTAAYDAEPNLPLPLEDVAVTHVHTKEPRTLCFALRKHYASELAGAIGNVGLQVSGFEPAAIALARVVRGAHPDASAIAIEGRASVDVIRYADGVVKSWTSRCIRKRTVSIPSHLKRTSQDPHQLAIVGSRIRPSDQDGWRVTRVDTDQLELLATHGLANDRDLPAMHPSCLGVDPSAGRPDRVFQSVMLACMIVLLVAAGFWRRGLTLDEAAHREREFQQSAYRVFHPAGSAPMSVADRLSSELRSVRERDTHDADIPVIRDLRLALEEIGGHPSVLVSRLAIRKDALTLEGVAPTSADTRRVAERLAAAIAQDGEQPAQPAMQVAGQQPARFTAELSRGRPAR